MTRRWTEADMKPLDGRRMIVTGGNSGIGLATVRALCRHGAEVIVASRDPDRGEAAASRAAAGTRGSARFMPLDLASLASIRRFAAAIEAADVLVNNAGVMAIPRRSLTEDGLERQFGTNHLGHFALTLLLMPALRRGSDPIVVTVASLAHRRARLDFDNLQGEKHYSAWGAYSLSKLANLMFAQELRRRQTQVGSVAVHPGVSFTSIVANGPGQGGALLAPLMQLGFRLFGQSAANGALPTLMAASGAAPPDAVYIGPDGLREMYGTPKPAWMTATAQNQALAARLWEVSERLTGVKGSASF